MGELIGLIIIAIVVFALIGFVSCIVWIARALQGELLPAKTKKTLPSANTNQSTEAQPTLDKDVLASRRLMQHLFQTGQITEQTFLQMRSFLEAKFADELKSTPYAPGASNTEIAKKGFAKTVDPKPAPAVTSAEDAPVVPVLRVESASEQQIKAATGVVFADLVTAEMAELAVTQTSATPAPWDRPDPPPLAPRRSFAEVMSVFMQEKNMRWGELTSGILIVLSAVGLVVSLRDELSDAIPYFSSILFMLITGAIIGAGIYTLKAWKLRNTSRGTLIIGLLLIPLNFVAACVLSGGADRRQLGDPLLWLAVAIGIGGFGAMTWWASKFLLRKNNWPLVISIIGCGAGTILINRMFELSSSSFHVLLLALPLVGSFLLGAGTLDRRLWNSRYWSPRGTTRLYLHVGISTFSILTALSLLLIRAEGRMLTAVAITPVLILVSLFGSWIGLILRTGNHAKDSNSLLVGWSLQILGLILAAIFLLASLANPTVLAINCFVAAMGLILIAFHLQSYQLMPAAWALLAAGVLAAINLFIGKFELDSWTSPEQLRCAVVNGQSGLCLLVCGAVAAGLQLVIARRVQEPVHAKFLRSSGLITGGCIFLVGCVVALIASLVNRHNVFDTMTASSLLLVAGFGSLAVSMIKNRKRTLHSGVKNVSPAEQSSTLKEQRTTLVLSNLAAVLLLAGLAHSLLWNPTIENWMAGLTKNIDANWVFVFAIHGLLLAIATAWKRPGHDQESTFYWSSVSCVIGIVGAITLVPQQTGFATIIMLAMTVAWWLIGWSIARIGASVPTSIKYAGVPFAAATAILVSVLIGELVSRLDWCPEFTQPRHWLIQIIGLSLWAIVWTFLSAILHRVQRLTWLVSAYPRVDQVVLHGLVIVVTALIVTGLAGGTIAELFKDANTISFALMDDQRWVFAALAAVSVAMLLLIVEQPTAIKGAAVVVLWMLAWSFGAVSFEASKSTASAIRWLLPLGGLVAAMLMSVRRSVFPVWTASRNRLQLQEPSSWKDQSTQRLINFALTIVAGVVLLISTVTVSQVMLNGAESLGGPAAGSWFGRMDKVISFGGPLALVVGSFLVYAISERRQWLATAGSAVFQYMVVLAVILLFLSPHPKLASAWFVRVLQSVSLGMTLYGFAWYLMRNRIQTPLLVPKDSDRNLSLTNVADSQATNAPSAVSRRIWLNQIEVHTVINGLLITSLALLVFARFFFAPDQPADWINSVGSLLGVVAWVSYAGLAFWVWRDKLTQQHSTISWLWLTGWMGFVLVAMIAAIVDFNFAKQLIPAPWTAFKLLTVGTLAVATAQAALLWFARWRERKSTRDGMEFAPVATSISATQIDLVLPLLLSTAIGLTFAVRGAWEGVTSFWLFVTSVGYVVALLFSTGLLLRRTLLTFLSAGVCLIGTTLVVFKSPVALFATNQPNWINLSFVLVSALALLNLSFYIYRRTWKHESIRRSFVRLPNAMVLLGSIWVLVGSLCQCICSATPFVGDSCLANPLGISAILLVTALLAVSLWNDRRRSWVLGFCLTSLGIVITGVSILPGDSTALAVGVLFGSAAAMTLWGIVWSRHTRWQALAKKLVVPRIVALKKAMAWQLPTNSLILMGILVVGSFVAILSTEERPLRYVAAATPLIMAIGMGCLSDPMSRRWLQSIALALVILGCLFVGWADLSPQQIWGHSQHGSSGLSLLVRSLLVLAGAMFVYGGLITRWVRAGDSWLKSLREMAAVTCGLAIVCLGLVVVTEAGQFREDIGCGLSLAEGVSVAFVVIGMIVGLISIAVRPERDPFALPLRGRQGYVYVAQLVAAGLVAHIYFSMPWLFQIGIKEYWPYIAMAICFGGVGVAHLLEQRNLTVLGQPLFTTAAILPVLTAAGIFAIDSRANGPLVMLTVGMAYLFIGYTHRSILSGAAAILFGNLALWMFYGEFFPSFSFFDHPQLWLIPPAISVLIAAQLNRQSLTASQLAMLRYVCVAVIYVSSTSEIFISGLGDKLWPPMVLALLAVIGIMSGILLQVRSFLYLGSLFLLMSMIMMVAHAHQRLNNVWPWWAFGVTLGVAILVMFGLFEKRKNEMKAIAERMKKWES